MINFRNVVCWLCVVAVVNAWVTPDAAAVDLERVDPRVNTILSIVGQFGYREEFVESLQGNNLCQWFGINCLEGIITSISFISLNLSGNISPRFADLTSLQVIDLSHNRLTGTIPLSSPTNKRTSLFKSL